MASNLHDIAERIANKSGTAKKAAHEAPEDYRVKLEEKDHLDDLTWYRDNIVPGFITWVNTVDPLLFTYYVGYCHTMCSENIATSRPAYIGQWGVYRQFAEDGPRALLGLVKSVASRLRQYSQWTWHGKAEPNKQIPQGWNRPIQYLEQMLRDVIDAQRSNTADPLKKPNDFVILPVTNEPARLATIAAALKEFYLASWGRYKVNDKGILPAGVPKIVLLTTEPVPFPDFFRRYALYVDFDAHMGSSSVCREMRKMDFPDYEAFRRLEESGFPATVMEQSAAASRVSTDILPLLKNSLLQSTRGLEILDTSGFKMETVGGMEYIRGWADFNKQYLSNEGFMISERPRGVILIGPPGTGKSMAAKVIANELNWPCIDLKIGDLFGGLVGETEKNADTVFKVLKHVRQAVVRLDEIEKTLGGSASSNKTDGGVLNRVVGKLLEFMEANDHQCIIVATSNDQKDIPGALMRSGRLDAVVFADVPSAEQRKAIIKIHATRHALELPDAEISTLAEETNHWSGKELADALLGRIQKKSVVYKKTTTKDHMKEAERILKEFTPIAKAKEQEFQKMREWAKTNAVDSNSKFT